MRRKRIFIHEDKEYIVKEPTVEMYWTFLVDIEQFLEEIFLEFNDKIPKLDKNQIQELLRVQFDIKQNDLDKLFKKVNKHKSTDNTKDFHLLIGKYAKFIPGENYVSIMKIPMKVFNDMLSDHKIINGEEEYKKDRHSQIPDKKGVKKLFDNQ